MKGRRKSVHFCSNEQSAIAPAVEMATADDGTDALDAGYDENRLALEFIEPDELAQSNMVRAPEGDLASFVMDDEDIDKSGAGDAEDRPVLDLINFDRPIQPNMVRAPANSHHFYEHLEKTTSPRTFAFKTTSPRTFARKTAGPKTFTHKNQEDSGISRS